MWTVVILAALVVGFALWVRLAPSEAAQWHVDPTEVAKTRKPNQYLLRNGDGVDGGPAIFEMPAAELVRAFDNVATARPGVERLAGSPDDLHVTYVQRTRLFGYPDYISVKVEPLTPDRAALSIYSRSRFGRSDFGVNKARVLGWLSDVGQAAR